MVTKKGLKNHLTAEPLEGKGSNSRHQAVPAPHVTPKSSGTMSFSSQAQTIFLISGSFLVWGSETSGKHHQKHEDDGI